jgi:hypothetical protein
MHQAVLVYHKPEDVPRGEPVWEPGVVVPADELRPSMLPQDDYDSFDRSLQLVVRLFADRSYVAPERQAVRLLDPNKRPFIACVAADEQFVHRAGGDLGLGVGL